MRRLRSGVAPFILAVTGLMSGVSLAQPAFENGIAHAAPPYHAEQHVSGAIRLWGHGNTKLEWVKQLVGYWEEGFRQYHPDTNFVFRMYGTSSAIPALYAGVGDLAILGEEIDPAAVTAFKKVKHYAPSGVEVMTGSLDVRNFDYAQMFFVHKDNPISQLTLAQLDAIFGNDHRRGLANIRTWGQLGLTGEWRDKAITPYGWRIDDSFGVFLQQTLLGNSHHWNCALIEYAHIYRPDGTIYDHGLQILDGLSKDRDGIAVSNIRYANQNVKSVAVGVREGGPFYPATKENLIERKYPLTRIIPAYYDRPPGMPVDPKVKEFLRYILSREGQMAIVRDGRYLPLTSDAIALQLRKLE